MKDYRKNYDVIVVGGGLTGSAAAVAAARPGCSVLLIEASGALGGAANTSLILPFMPNATKIESNGKKILTELSQGFFTELKQRLDRFGAVDGLYFHEEYMKIVLDELMKENGVTVLFHAVLCDAAAENGELKEISVITKAGRLTFAAKQFIDCTGDADLAVMCGCPYHLGRKEDGLCQPMTLCFRVAGVDKERFFSKESRELMQSIYTRRQQEGKTSNPRENILVFNTLIDGVVHFNTTRIVKRNPVDPFDVSYAEAEGRKQMLEIFMMLKQELPAFKNAQLLTSAALVGARESRMIDGEYLLTEEDLKNCVRFPDAIAAGNYDIDIHNPSGSGTSHYYFPEGEYYTIPFRSLIPKGVNNLLVAGRCISSTHEAQASYRIMPIVTTLGQAAGTAAGLAVSTKLSDIKQTDIPALQKALLNAGAFLG